MLTTFWQPGALLRPGGAEDRQWRSVTPGTSTHVANRKVKASVDFDDQGRQRPFSTVRIAWILSATRIRSLANSLRHFRPWNRYSLARQPVVKVEWCRLPHHSSEMVELVAEDAELGQVRIIQLDRRHVRQAIED